MRTTITTAPSKLFDNPSGRAKIDNSDDYLSVSGLAFSPTSSGTVLVESGATDVAPDMTNAARWDFSKAMLTYACEPGRALWAKTSSGTVDLDIVKGGER